jgi:hypothetical protein
MSGIQTQDASVRATKIVHALDRVATVLGYVHLIERKKQGDG